MGPEAALAQTAVVQERFGALIGRNASAAHRWGRAKTQFEREIAKSTAVATILNREAVVADRTAQMASRIEAKRRIIASIEEMTAAGRLLENEAELQRLYLSWATLGSIRIAVIWLGARPSNQTLCQMPLEWVYQRGTCLPTSVVASAMS